jgi:hypothetical protein
MTIAAVVVALAGCGSSSSAHSDAKGADADADADAPAVATTTVCTPPPPPVASIAVPTDPPFPAGTYGIASPDKRVAVIVSGSSTDFASYVVKEWPKAGWSIGRGDSERNEAEDDVSKGNVRGHFWAQAKFCGHSEVLLQLTGS